jgi:hypothetical protein
MLLLLNNTTRKDLCGSGENRINEIVYELYGLTEEEINIVEDR